MASEIEAFGGLQGAFLIRPHRISDARGYFSETFRESDLARVGIHERWVQENKSLSLHKGTLRGMHFQKPPNVQAKLVRCITGAALDVIIDLRPDSSTFGKHASVEISGENGLQLYVPKGFAHGFCTLTDECRFVYKTSDYYAPSSDCGISWNDPALQIAWPFDEAQLTLSERDKAQPGLEDVAGIFAVASGGA